MSEKQDNKVDLNLLQSLGLELLWCFSRALSLSPRWFRFGLFQPFVTLLLRIIGYRSRVIIQNLEGAFPEKSKSEIRKIKNRYYSTLSEVIIDTMCLAGADASCRGKYMVWEDVDKHVKDLAGRDWIALGSHYGCWEYLSTWHGRLRPIGLWLSIIRYVVPSSRPTIIAYATSRPISIRCQ